MSIRFTSFHICFAAAILALSGLFQGNVHAGGKERGRPIEFSLPKSDEVTTNLHELTGKKDSLKQLEEDLYKPLEAFSSKSSLEGVAVLPPRAPSVSPIQSKRVKELLERRMNWVFMSPEDMVGAPTVEDVLKTPQIGPDGQEKKELPAIERYYHRLSNKRVEPDSPMRPKSEALFNPTRSRNEDLFGAPRESNSRDERVPQEDSFIPSGVKESVQALSKLVESDSNDGRYSRSAAHGDLSDTFGLGNQPLSKEQMQDHKKLMDDYRSMVDPSWHPPAVATAENLLTTLTAEVGASAGKPATGTPSSLNLAPPTAIEAQMDVTSPRLGPAGLADVNAHALGQTRPAAVLPMSEPTRLPTPGPTFSIPKRAFY